MGYKSDIEIAQECEMLPITQIAEKAGIDDKYLEQYGKYKAKIDYNLLKESDKKDGKLILVTAINPTPAGEGKTTTTVGLADGMQRLGKSAMVALREPSLGPVFGVKGGAAGGGIFPDGLSQGAVLRFPEPAVHPLPHPYRNVYPRGPLRILFGTMPHERGDGR